MYDKETQEIFEKLSIFDKMYEQIRFVDPIFKKEINYKNKKVSELTSKCYDFWEKNHVCENCISILAYQENKTYVKVEYVLGRVYVVTAVPYEMGDRRVVIELMNNTTDSMIYTNGDNGNESEVYAMIDNMNKQVLKDPLTGIYNRRYINEKLPIDMVNEALTGQDISIILTDIDFFKKVNDNYGHLSGDEVLKSFATTISECLQRESDWVARFGGEEFLVCLPGAGTKKAVEIAEKMRQVVESKAIYYNGVTISITSSFGVCSMKPEKGTKMEDIIEQADKKLYLAKKNGRNRVVS